MCIFSKAHLDFDTYFIITPKNALDHLGQPEKRAYNEQKRSIQVEEVG